MNTPKTHPLNVSYLVVGLVFLGIAGSWALHASGAVDSGDVQWLLPAVLLLAGAVGLVGFAAKGISRGRQDRWADELPAGPAEPVDEPWATYDSEADDETSDETTRIEGENR